MPVSRLLYLLILFVPGLLSTSLGCRTRTSGFPTAVVPARPSATDWPDVGAIILEDVALLDYKTIAAAKEGGKPRLAAVLEHRQRIKVLTEAGLKAAHFELLIDGYTTVTDVAARSVSADGVVTQLPREDVQARTYPESAKQAPDIKRLVFTVPGATVGGIIDVRYRRIYTTPELVPVWVFGKNMPVVRAEFSLTSSAGSKLDYRYGHGEEVKDVKPLTRSTADGRERYVFIERNLPAFYWEPEMPHMSRVAPWIAPVLVGAKLGDERLRADTWKKVGLRTLELFAQVGSHKATGSPPLRFQTVRDAVRGLDWPGLGVRRPVPAKGLMSGEPACSRDASALLIAALQGSKIDAYPALLTAPGGPAVQMDLPGFYPFVRTVVAIDAKEAKLRDPSCRADPRKRGLVCDAPANSYVFLDPSCRHCRFGELPLEFTGGKAMIVLPNGAFWFDVPLYDVARNTSMTQYRMALDVDGAVRGQMNGELSGAFAREYRQALAPPKVATKERAAILSTMLYGNDAGPALSQANASPWRRMDRPLGIRADVELKLPRNDFEDFRASPMDLVGPALPGRWRASRRYERLLPGPGWSETVVSIELPVGYKASPPPVAKVVTPFAEYAAGFAFKDGMLHYSRRLVLKRRRLFVEEWDDFYLFVKKIEGLEKRGIRVHLAED